MQYITRRKMSEMFQPGRAILSTAKGWEVNKKKLLQWLLVPFAVLGACAQAAPVTDYQRILDDATRKGVPGVQVVVLQSASIWSGVSGLASIEKKEPMSPHHRIRLASVTKMMTYATIVELVRQGRLALSDRAVDRLPAGALAGIPNADQITIEHLLEHSSGLHNFNGPNGADFVQELYTDPQRSSRIWSQRELIAFAAKPGNGPVNAPGERRDYSSTGYIILEMIAEQAASEPLPSLYHRYIFRPFGMTESGFEGFDLRGSDIVASYARPDGAVEPASPFAGRKPIRADGLVNLSADLDFFNAWARGAGAAASTACDLGKFMRAVTDSRLTVLKDQAETFGNAKKSATASFNWNGGSAGIQSSIFYAPGTDVVVIVLTNGTNAGPGSIDIARSLLAAARSRIAAGTPAAVSPCPPSRTALDTVQDVAREYERFFQTGDRAAFDRVFAANGSYITLPRDLTAPIGVRSFAEAFPGWAAEPDPQARVGVVEVSFLGERMALLRLWLQYGPRVYLDQLSLYRVGQDWKVVAKQTQAGRN